MNTQTYEELYEAYVEALEERQHLDTFILNENAEETALTEYKLQESIKTMEKDFYRRLQEDNSPVLSNYSDITVKELMELNLKYVNMEDKDDE